MIAPDAADMLPANDPVHYTDKQVANGVNRSEVVTNQTKNNALWEQDRLKLSGLQAYIKTLQEKGIIAK